tara:strand:+ start:2746 stop:3612 length:867 start_codon:yes stop_codon:yes gene_type:complete
MDKPFYKEHKKFIDNFIHSALEEDIGKIDYSSESCIPTNSFKSAKLFVKKPCVIAGVELAEKIFKYFDPKIIFKKLMNDGEVAKFGSIPFTVDGKAKSILATERVVLNTMQRMSGISTITKSFRNKIIGFDCKILDTRKTSPNFRYPEKWAVKIGGGENHRMGLFDSIIIKDNHIDYCGGMNKTLIKVEKYLKQLKSKKPILIVETRNLGEIKDVLKYDFVDRILLDNMSISRIKMAVKIINKKIKVEVSGNISSSNIQKIAETGVDYMSIGALTHSAPHIDLSLKAI